MITPAHREEQVKSAAPQVHIEDVGGHRPRHLDIGDEEHVLVRRAFERDPAELAHAAASAIAPGQPGDPDLAFRTVRAVERRRHVIGVLREADQLGVPLHGEALVSKRLAQQTFVVVLPQDQQVGIRAHIPSDVSQRHACSPPPVCPQDGAVGFFAEGDCLVGDAQVRIDLERACLHAQRPRLACRTGVPVDDPHAHATPGELVREHQPGGAGSHDEDVRICGHITARAISPPCPR